MTFKNLSAVLLATAALAASASATIVIGITVNKLSSDTAGTTPVVAGTLLQLVNLGADGVFNEINIADANSSGIARWVSGDDSVINLAFLNAGSTPGDFPSTAAFDLSNGVEPTNGRSQRSFEFANLAIPAGTKIGIRWFPTLQATDFASITLAAGTKFGQFTRQDTPQYANTTLWVAPSEGSSVNFDNLKTTDVANGLDPVTAGAATFTVVPEPAAIGMSLIGAAGLAMLRRRRA